MGRGRDALLDGAGEKLLAAAQRRPAEEFNSGRVRLSLGWCFLVQFGFQLDSFCFFVCLLEFGSQFRFHVVFVFSR